MPSFRGIEVSILTQSLAGKLPEFPHSDGSCLQKRCEDKVSEACQPALLVCGHQDADEHDPTTMPKSSPRISVYVPSLPGSQFWIRYAVENEPDPTSHLFFKLYMNGRHITSWGINPRMKSKGQVEKALYEPCDRWDREENGVIFKPEGIEARYFYFVSDQQQLSIADDGGLIEVHVFRAKGRKRRAARLDQYRHMDRYGITAPSGGLVDNPQDVTFFDFHLIDPKDIPFATFHFHYRSLANLHQLNLIPTDDLRTMLPSPDDNAKKVVDTISKGSFTIFEDESCSEEQLEPARREPDETVFDEGTSNVSPATPASVKCNRRRNSSYIWSTPPQLRPRSASSQIMPQPSKSFRDALPIGFPESYLTRALPTLPLAEVPTDGPNDACMFRSRKSSTASAAPSVALSLLSYVKDESYMEEEVLYGEALEVPINKDHPGVPLHQERTLSTLVSDSARVRFPSPAVVIDASMSDYEVSPLTSDDSKDADPTLLSPGNNMAITESVPENHITSPQDAKASTGRGINNLGGFTIPGIKRADTRDLALDLNRFPHLQLSESDWIRRTPSPERVPRGVLSPRLGRLWNTLRRHKSRSPLRNPREKSASLNRSTPQLSDTETKEKHGNWI